MHKWKEQPISPSLCHCYKAVGREGGLPVKWFFQKTVILTDCCYHHVYIRGEGLADSQSHLHLAIASALGNNVQASTPLGMPFSLLVIPSQKRIIWLQKHLAIGMCEILREPCCLTNRLIYSLATLTPSLFTTISLSKVSSRATGRILFLGSFSPTLLRSLTQKTALPGNNLNLKKLHL